MDGAEYTVKKVADEATKELLLDLQSAKESAERATAARLEQTLAEVQKINEQQLRQADALKRQMIGSAEMNARNKSLAILEEGIDSAFREAEGKLGESAKGSHYEGILKSLLVEAMDQVGGDNFVVQVSSRDQKAGKSAASELAKEMDATVELAKAPIETVGGVKVASSDGYVLFDNTFEARLERMKPVLRKRVAEIFAEGKSDRDHAEMN